MAAAHASNNSLLEAIGGGIKAYAATTADAIANRVAAAFPAEALRAELNAAPRSSYFSPYKRSLITVINRNGGFDLQNGSYGALAVPTPGSNPFRGVADKEAVKGRLATMSRLIRAVPQLETPVAVGADSRPLGSFATIAALADKGYESSSAISRPRRPRSSRMSPRNGSTTRTGARCTIGLRRCVNLPGSRESIS